MTESNRKKLIDTALKARRLSYSPYSGFAVGAALMTDEGKIYTGTNIESASFSPTVCAERVAFFSAIASGERNFCAIAVVGGRANEEPSEACPPCGVCRQVMAEFCTDGFEIILYDGKDIKIHTLSQLLPHRFDKNTI